jgi:hypothetical protein
MNSASTILHPDACTATANDVVGPPLLLERQQIPDTVVAATAQRVI